MKDRFIRNCTVPNQTDRRYPGKKSSPDDKGEHIRLCLESNMESNRSNGFEKYRLVNQPLPEILFSSVDTSCRFLGKDISAPFIISPLTGGNSLSKIINTNLAKAAQALGLVLAVGSQRLALENPDLAATYQIRQIAPDIPIIANLGAIYLNYGFGLKDCEAAVKMIQADALCLYLNPMQKILQGGRDLNFKGLVNKIAHLCRHLSVPVMVKEVGFGLSPLSAELLADAGVACIDIAGAGGTSWAKITRKMKNSIWGETGACFDDWGTPTAEALVSVRKAVGRIQIVASGGIRNGLDMAKALALGADYAGMALPLLRPATQSANAVKLRIEAVLQELRITMFCSGIRTLEGFNGDRNIIELCLI